MKRTIIVTMLIVLLCATSAVWLSCRKIEAASTTGGLLPGMIIGYDSSGSLTYYNECDGSCGTPNLQDKMIVGAGGNYQLNATGGATTHLHSYTGTAACLLSADDDIEGGVGYTPGGSATVTAGNTDTETSLPPYEALPFWQVASGTQGIPYLGIVWWDGTLASIPTHWTAIGDLFNSFAIGSGNLYNRSVSGGASDHTHNFGIGGTFTIGTGSGVNGNYPIKNKDKNGTWGASCSSDTLSHLPPYYALLPIMNETGGTCGITTGMVLPYNGDPNDLPAGWSEFTGARDRFVVGAGSTYAAGDTGGNLTHNHAMTPATGSGGLNSGSKLCDNTPDGDWNEIVGIQSIVITDANADNLPPYHALFWVKKD